MGGSSGQAHRSVAVRGAKGVGAGRSLHALQAFGPGELITTFTSPILALPDGPSSKAVCNHCLAHNAQMRACTGCKAVVYCSPACQKANWGLVHRLECRAFRRVRSSVDKDWLPTPVRALVQISLRSRGEPEVQAALEALEDNVGRFREKDGLWGDLELQAVAGVTYAGIPDSAQELEKAIQILCKVQTNAFDRTDVDTGQAGIFLDATLAMTNHSCTPNATVSFVGRTALLRAETPIRAGQEITISYIDYTKPRVFRQLGLELYHFECACPRCREDLDVYEVCQRSPLIPLNSFSMVPDLGKFRDPPTRISGARRTALKAETVNLYAACQVATEQESGDRILRLRHQWRQCLPLIEAEMWAIEPLSHTLEGAIVYYTERASFGHALSVACFAALRCDPYKHVAPFKQWRLKGVMIIAKLLTNTASDHALEDLARTSHPGVTAVLRQADQVSMCQALLLMVIKYAPMAHSEEWEVLSLAKAMLRDIETLEDRSIESALLRSWADGQDAAGNVYFEKQVLAPIESLAALAIDILSADLGS